MSTPDIDQIEVMDPCIESRGLEMGWHLPVISKPGT